MFMGYVLTGVYENIKYEAFYDEDTDILHVLDAMGFNVTSKAYKSVTNGIELLLKNICRDLRIKKPKFCFIYGTDNVITAYNVKTKAFASITDRNVFIFGEFKEKMHVLYDVE